MSGFYYTSTPLAQTGSLCSGFSTELDAALFGLLLQTESREMLRLSLLETYFKEQSGSTQMTATPYLLQLVKEILYEAPQLYQIKYQELQKQLSKKELEEETFVRDGAFKKVIANLYNHRCAISGLRVKLRKTSP